MRNHKQTSPRIAELAGKTLGDPRALKKSKALTPLLKLRRAGAGSALVQGRQPSRPKRNPQAAVA
jgi:hypothetical protein